MGGGQIFDTGPFFARLRYMQLIFKGCIFISNLHLTHTITHTQILDDPSGNSFVENQLAPSPNPDLTTEFYPRSEEQNRDLGLLSTATEVNWAVCFFYFHHIES